MLIGIDKNGHLWVELERDGTIMSATTNAAIRGIRWSCLEAKDYITYSIDHTDLIKALIAMRDGAKEPVWMDEVRDLLRKKDKIGAIKAYRTHTRLGLKEAKDAVDMLCDEEGL